MRPAMLTMISMFWLAFSTVAAAQNKDAEAFLKARHQNVQKILEHTAKDTVGDELSKEIGNFLDYETLSQRALVDHWGDHSEAERTEFVSLLKQLVERNYRKNLRSTLGLEIKYEGSTAQSDDIVVKTVAKSKTNKRQPAVEISYTMHQASGAWRVVDITTDGVSMVRNYRGQFNRIIRKDGWPELIRRMKDRLANEGDF